MFGYAPYCPSLPEGYSVQSHVEFHDPGGRFSYAFHRVYGPAGPIPGHPAVVASRLDEGRSYWIVTWAESSERDGEHPAGRWMSYAEARAQQGRRLTFARFSSAGQMREALPELLHPRAAEGGVVRLTR